MKKQDPKKTSEKKSKNDDDALLKEIKELNEREKEFKKILDQLKDAENKIQDLDNNYKRALADLQNYRKRVELEKADLFDFANASLLDKILPSVDNFKRALDFIPKNVIKENWCQGIIHSMTHFFDELKKLEITEIECVGKKLDLNLHEAVMQGPGEKDIIIEIFENGYTMKGKIIRPAKVKVGDGSKK